MINAKQIRACSSEFLTFVQDCEANRGNKSWKEAVYTRAIQVDGVEVPVYSYVMGRNASHQFTVAVSLDGNRWFKIFDGEGEIPVDKWSPEEHAHYAMLCEAASGMPVEFYSQELAKFALSEYIVHDGKVKSVIGGVTEVDEYSSLEDASAGYMGHW